MRRDEHGTTVRGPGETFTGTVWSTPLRAASWLEPVADEDHRAAHRAAG